MEIKDFTLGADPEFALSNSKGELFSYEKFRNKKKKSIFKQFNKKLGKDGGWRLFEIRPAPSYDPLEVVQNIKDVFVQMANDPVFNGYFPVAKPFLIINDTYNQKSEETLGGHIHFGGPYIQNRESIQSNYFLYYFSIISILLEGSLGEKRRNLGDYGEIFDIREQNHGFEARCPSTWLNNPEFTTTILCLAKVIMFEFLNEEENFNLKWKEGFYLTEDEDRSLFKKEFEKKWPKIKEMKLYPKYEEYLEIIPQLIKSNRNFYLSEENIYKNWNII